MNFGDKSKGAAGVVLLIGYVIGNFVVPAFFIEVAVISSLVAMAALVISLIKETIDRQHAR